MKRYRVFSGDFDSRASTLAREIQDSWEESVKELHLENRRKIEESILSQFGELAYEEKRHNFIELGPAPFSILAFHNKFLRQITTAFVMGAYYPSLAASCALGERILNHLILLLRDDYKGTPEYGRVHRKKSFDNWDEPIGILETWGVFVPDVATAFGKLRDIRNDTIHFRPEVDSDDRELALKAIRLLKEIVERQFPALGTQRWFIRGTPGECFIRKAAEQDPFVRKVYLPNCVLVGPYYWLEPQGAGWLIHDVSEYEDREITDEEFVKLRNQGR